MAGLREQWRRTAMQEIRERALDLFDERGFAAVTIEQVAAAAGVSPSSVYRYFGTKEGLVVQDDDDAWSDAGLVDPTDPVGSLLLAVHRFDAPDDADESIARRRIRHMFGEPSVRAALLASLDRAARRIAPMLSASGDMTELQARVAANAIAFGYLAALERWHADGASRPVADYVEDGLQPLRSLWGAAG